MKWAEISNDDRYINSTPEIQLQIQEDWFQKNIKSDPRFKPELENKIKNDIFGKLIPEIKQGKPESFLESLFHKSAPDEIAKSQNIYTISQRTGKSPQDIEKNYDREKVRYLDPPESFTPEDKVRRTLDQGFAKGLIGTKSVYPEFDAEHPVLNAIGQGAGNLAGLIATGESLKGLGIGGEIYKNIVTKFGLGAIPIAKTAAKVIETGITFGTKTAAEKALQLQNHEDITLKSGKDILDSTLFGMGLGAVGSIAKPIVRIPGEMIYGYTTAKMQGADNLNATINAAVFGIFGLANLSDYSKEYKISAINKVTETTAKKMEGFGLTPAEAQRQAKTFIEGNVLKTTGETDVTKAWDKVLTSKEYNLKYFDNLNESMKSLERASPKLAEQGIPAKSAPLTPEQQTTLENTFKDELDKDLAKVINPEALKAAEASKVVAANDLAQQEPITPVKPVVVAGETPAPVVEPPSAKNEIITDPARIQEIKNSIAEGEMILKSGKTVSGRKMSSEELGAIQTSVDNAKMKIETALEAKNISSVIEKSGGTKVKIVPLKDSMLMDKNGNPEQMVQFDDAKGSTHILRISEVTPENVKAKVGQLKKEYVEVKLSNEDKIILEQIKKDIEFASPGNKYVTRDEITGDVVKAGYEPSDYSYIPYWPEGWSGKPINTIIDNAVNKGKLTIKQKEKLDTLLSNYREASNEQARIEKELSSEGTNQSEIDENKRIGEAEAHGAVESRERTLDAYRKAILPEYNTSKEIIEVDALVDKIRELNPKDESDAMWIKEGNKYEATVSYPHSLGENGNQTTFVYKDKPTVTEIKQDVLREYKDFKKDVNKELAVGVVAKSGRDENIEAAIDKVLEKESNLTPSGKIREELHAPLKKDLFQERGELFKQVNPPSGSAFAKDSILWGNNIPIEQGTEYYKLKSLEMPELVRLARELTGLYPTIVKKTGNAAGRFYSKNGQIKLIAELFKQGKEQELAIVLAHEIGHLIDWLPDNTLKRGNLLGRLLSLRNYLKQTFGDLEKEQLGFPGTQERISNKVIKDELIKVTQYMHPFDPKGVPHSYLQYRYSSRELYAEAISLLLNSPGTIEKMAPQFTKSFFENLDKKLDVKEAYFDMLELLNGERSDVLDALDQDIRRMFAKADPLRAQKMAEKKISKVSMFERLRQFVDNKYQPILKKIENMEKMGGVLPAEKNPRYILEEYAMANNKIYEWCLKLDTDVKKELDLAELTEIDFGVYVFLKRIIGRPVETVEETQEFDEEEVKQFANQFTDRKDMANPLGVDPKRAQEQLDFLKAKLGEEKFAKLEQAADNFHKLVFGVVEDAVKVGSYNQKVFKERIEPNKDTYVSFGVINYMQNFVSAGVKKQMGTLGEIENPFITTVLKTVSLIKLNEKQRAVNSIRDMLKNNFSEEIKASKFIQKEGLRVFLDSPGTGRIQLLEDGRMASYDVDPYIAKSLEYDSTETSHEIGKLISTIFGNNMFKQLYITYNPGFAFAFNPIRDFKRTYKNLQAMGRGVTIRTLLVEYAKNLPTAYRRLNGVTDELITEMIGNRALEINFDDFIEAYTDKSLAYNEILKRYGLAKNNEEVKSLRKTILKPLVKVLEFIRFHGAALESISKISGYNILKQKDVYPAERAYITRNYIGTPNFRNKGLVTDTTNAVWMFSNIIKEGFKADMYLATNPKTRSGYWWATAKLDLLPKLLMVLAGAGLFGVKVKELMDKASEYDKTNYIIIPIGEHKGKAAYLRIPHDETGRLMAALFYKIANTLQGKPEQLQQIFSFGAGQLPNLAPGIQIAAGWMTYLQGQNPYDNFRGRTIISDTEWKAGGWNSLKKMIQWTVNQSGQVSFATYSKDSNSTFESVVQMTPIINRLLKISDYGVTEELKQIKEDVQKENARESLLKREEFKKGAELIGKGTDAIEVLKGIKKSVYGNQVITSKEANLLLKGLARETLKHREDDPFVDALIYSTTNEEKKRIIIKMRDKMPLSEFKNTLKTLYNFRIFSDQVMTANEWKKVLSAD